MNKLVAVLLVLAVAVTVSAFEDPDLDALAEFCGKESNKKYCDQIAVLAAENVHKQYENQEQMQMEKRKPSFVRFGKRSGYPLIIDQQELQMDKRKPSFVRFGRK